VPDIEYVAASLEQEGAYLRESGGANGPQRSMYRAILLSGGLSAAEVLQALSELTARHEILRTTLESNNNQILQVIRDEAIPDFSFEDSTSRSSYTAKTARELAARFCERPFHHDGSPLWRVLLIKLLGEQHVLVLSMHATVGDPETLMLFLEQLVELLGSDRAEETQQHTLTQQYRAHSATQSALAEERLTTSERYWANYYHGEIRPAELPTSRHHPSVEPNPRTASLQVILPDELTTSAEAYVADADVSLATALVAGFVGFLYRYGARQEITFGVRVPTDRRPADKNMLGPQGSTRLVRLPISKYSSFNEMLQTTDAHLKEASKYSGYPFQRLKRALPQVNDLETVPLPLFQLSFESELHIKPAFLLSRPALAIDDFDVPSTRMADPLRVVIRRRRDGVALDWSYNSDLFTSELVAQFNRHMTQLLSEALKHPSTPLSELKYLLADDLQEITRNWNTTRTNYRSSSVGRLIEERVASSSDCTAVEFGDEKLTYATLNEDSNQLARYLVSLGVSSGEMVGICLDRSVDLIVTLLAVLKLGGVVLPLDPGYPRSRLDYMVKDSGAKFVVTATSLNQLSSSFAGLTQVSIDSIRDRIIPFATHNLELDPGADSPAYCIYTSGSTGRPKGVIVEHRAIANLIAWHVEQWLSTIGTRTLLYSPISFDVAFHEILVGLCSGATLVQVDETTRRNPMAMLDFAREERIEKWYMPFVTLQQIAQAALTSTVPTTLAELIVGGEPLRITPEIRDFARKTGCTIRNHYGSTECLEVATYTLSGDPDHWPDIAPVGYPNVDNMNMYILDDSGDLVPKWVTGQIFAEGDLLARGYHDQEALTEERFRPSPFNLQGPRLYGMGDLGRYLPDGTVECLGRIDGQVKIRGFRVEPGEVEAMLGAHPAVAECAVSAVKVGTSTRLAAHVVIKQRHTQLGVPELLKAALADQLPDYLVPSSIIVLDSLPRTPSGKLDRRALAAARTPKTTPLDFGKVTVRERISKIWRDLLGVTEIDVRKTFFELGGDSILLVQAHQQLAEHFGRTFPVVTLFRYPTVEALASYLENPDASPSQIHTLDNQLTVPLTESRDIAIIGMSCRVPGADNVSQFWSNLCAGVESVTRLTDAELSRCESPHKDNPDFVPAISTISGIDRFDASFFGYSAAEAEVIDPQQRLFLECAWEAIEDSGADAAKHSIGVFAGSSMSTYLVNNVLPAKLPGGVFLSHRSFEDATDLRLEQGNARDHLSSRVSFKLNLRGPSINVQSTCSTSLVAVHLAGQALRDGDCEIAIAGGVSIITPQDSGYVWRNGMMLSSDGHCRAFDAEADGTIFGNGLGAVVLKPLSTALLDGDQIYAVIRGSAINNDGALKVDYSGPSVQAQADVIARAHSNARVTADDISYVEAHGTGTKLGDPVEIAGLTQAFRRSLTRDDAHCAIGSVKTNIGHLDEASGVIGLIKTALALHHGKIPASLNFLEANPLCGLPESPFFINSETRAWPQEESKPRVAGISAFGMGGTNCHVIVAERPIASSQSRSADRSIHVLPLSGRSHGALRGNVERYLKYLEESHDVEFADVCYSAATGRKHFEARAAILANSAEGARIQLTRLLNELRPEPSSSTRADQKPKTAFLFTGQGSQYRGMGRSLFETEPVFRLAVGRCDEILRPLMGRSLIDILYGDVADTRINDTQIAQPALFAVGYALSQLWDSWGVRPDVLIGHSLGELTAACVSGVFSLEDGLKLVAARGRLMQNLSTEGDMYQVNTDPAFLVPYLNGFESAVAIAAVNSRSSCVLSGNRVELDFICSRLRAVGVEIIPLNVSHAFHSPMMAPILDSFRQVAETVTYSAPAIDIISNVSGALAGTGELQSPDYWVRHISSTVEFYKAMQTVDGRGIRAFIEIGPKPTLNHLGQAAVVKQDIHWLPSILAGDSNAALESLRVLYSAGVPIDWDGFHAPFRRSRLPVPTYAFQRGRYWIQEPKKLSDAPVDRLPPNEALNPEPVDYAPVPIYDPGWKLMGTVPASRQLPGRYVVLGRRGGLGEQLARRLRDQGHTCTNVFAEECRSDPQAGLDAGELSRALSGLDLDPSTLNLIFVPQEIGDSALAAATLLEDARSVLQFAAGNQPVKKVWFVTKAPPQTQGSSKPELGLCGAAALVRTINVEYPNVRCASLTVPADISVADFELAARVTQYGHLDTEEELAIRNGRVYAARLKARKADSRALPQHSTTLPIQPDGIYIITGGTGGLGLQVALRVARQRPRRLVLVSRRGKSAPEDARNWAALLATGVDIETPRADVADEAAVVEILATCGKGLKGIFHCAGSLDDDFLMHQTAARSLEVLRPKITGALLLHEHTQEMALDFFVMFSSLSSLLGYPGQSSYALANSLLDSLAEYRKERDLPALSVCWGSWGEVGMAHRLAISTGARSRTDGETAIAPHAGLNALAQLMNEEKVARVAVASVDWTMFGHSRGRGTSMLNNSVFSATPETSRGPAAQFDAALRAAEPEEAQRMVWIAVREALNEVLGRESDALIDPLGGFRDMGLDSLGSLDLSAKLQQELGLRLPATVALEYPDLDSLVAHLQDAHFSDAIAERPVQLGESGNPRRDPIQRCAEDGPRGSAAGDGIELDGVAIIGMACNFPGAPTPQEYWALLVEGRDAVVDIPSDRWDVNELYASHPDVPGKTNVRRAALMSDPACFDHEFFGISPREAKYMDPRHRLILESAWSAIESAGIDPKTLRDTDTGVYLGGDEFTNDYLRLAGSQLGSESYLATGTTLSFMAGRLSFKLGLRGPSSVISTACSSSLVAMHSAVQAVRYGECDMAIAGGAKLILGAEETVQLSKLGALSPDGVSKVFSADADGFGRGEGCAVLLLKRLEAAIADGDPVLAVVRGTAINHGGPSSGLTVPSAKAQAQVIVRALKDANLKPNDVTYVEAHGTGTELGDPIELNALKTVFQTRSAPLLVGSAKANVGHLEEVSGLAGVIKVILSFQHSTIPPQIHCNTLSDKVDWEDTPVEIQRARVPWPPNAKKIAGVSSFGMSGTNAHVLLESFVTPTRSERTKDESYLFPFSARDAADLEAAVARFVAILDPAIDLAQVAYTLQIGRTPHACRLAVVTSDVVTLHDSLKRFLGGDDGLTNTFRGTLQQIEKDRSFASRPWQYVAGMSLGEVARAWCRGSAVEWAVLYPGQAPRRVALPGYPFKRQRSWVDSESQAAVPYSALIARPHPEPAVLVGPDGSGQPNELSGLRAHVAQLLGMTTEGLSTTALFTDLGVDSMIFMRISQYIREQFNVVLSFQQLTEEAINLKDLFSLVSAHADRTEADGPYSDTAAELSEQELPGKAAEPVTPSARAQELTDRQARFVSDFVEAYGVRSQGSKVLAARDRKVMANCRMPPFQALLKEISYPIVADHSSGPKFWDVDGNEYLDISMGYGVHLFGHQPAFIVEALRSQLERGIHIGPLARDAGAVASKLCELTGMSRAVFCNSGTEAVMAALRFARARTQRSRFVMFEGSYHGWADNTLALPAGSRGSIPMARGVGAGAMNDVVVLEYGTSESLETIRALGPELAAVLVEPVQSRRPDFQPIDFLRELRAITHASGSALVFDEVITGFRSGLGGAQEWAGVKADLVTYGKILGGGMPIGAVAGRADFLDVVDGGPWSFGDESSPSVSTTFFGGTFNKNPMSMASAHAVLTHLEAEGPRLQARLAEGVSWLADEFNDFCRRENFPLEVVHFSSLFRFIGQGEYSLQRFPVAMDLFFHMLCLKGIYVLETRVCFLSTSHSQDDIRFILDTAKSCLTTLRGGGFFEAPLATVGTRPTVLASDSRLSSFAVPGRAPSGATQDVLLTGATGFLGAHLIRDLLQTTSARIHCLVRARDAEHAHERVLANLTQHGGPLVGAEDRVVAISADLSMARLGLSDAVWQRLADEIGTIYHNGALVNSLWPYEKLKRANVDGTRELLQLAVTGWAKTFHHVSSDAVFDAFGYLRQASIYEDEPLSHSENLFGGGYAETKWVADKLVENARGVGLDAFIYRPANIIGAAADGCGQPEDFFGRFVQGVIQLGVCPDLDATIDILSVDTVSRSIVQISQSESARRTFHLAHPKPITYIELVEAIRSEGHSLDVAPLHVWTQMLEELRYEDENPLYLLKPLFTESADPVFRRARLDISNSRQAGGLVDDACASVPSLIANLLAQVDVGGRLS
jgi:amino acid adenylation domain-containing protein/thioester reductase-like protein